MGRTATRRSGACASLSEWQRGHPDQHSAHQELLLDNRVIKEGVNIHYLEQSSPNKKKAISRGKGSTRDVCCARLEVKAGGGRPPCDALLDAGALSVS